MRFFAAIFADCSRVACSGDWFADQDLWPSCWFLPPLKPAAVRIALVMGDALEQLGGGWAVAVAGVAFVPAAGDFVRRLARCPPGLPDAAPVHAQGLEWKCAPPEFPGPVAADPGVNLVANLA